MLTKDLAYRYLAIDPVYFRYPFTQSLKRLVRLQAEGYGDTFTPDSVGVFIDLINGYGLRVKQAREFVEEFVGWFGDVDALRRALDDVDSQIFGGGVPVRDYRAYTVDYLKRELHKLS